jgi:hypothetical protein
MLPWRRGSGRSDLALGFGPGRVANRLFGSYFPLGDRLAACAGRRQFSVPATPAVRMHFRRRRCRALGRLSGSHLGPARRRNHVLVGRKAVEHLLAVGDGILADLEGVVHAGLPPLRGFGKCGRRAAQDHDDNDCAWSSHESLGPVRNAKPQKQARASTAAGQSRRPPPALTFGRANRSPQWETLSAFAVKANGETRSDGEGGLIELVRHRRQRMKFDAFLVQFLGLVR